MSPRMMSVAEVAVVAVDCDVLLVGVVVDSKGSNRGGVATQGQDLNHMLMERQGRHDWGRSEGEKEGDESA